VAAGTCFISANLTSFPALPTLSPAAKLRRIYRRFVGHDFYRGVSFSRLMLFPPKGVTMKKATLLAAGVLLGSLFAAGSAKAQCFGCQSAPQAANAFSPSFYCQNCSGQWYGPNNNMYPPPFPPFNGMVYAPTPPPQARFPSHPFARGPRDYFMYEGK
jgi:hypothetical protein